MRYKKIKLTQNKFAIVDEEDYARVSERKWCCFRYGDYFRAVSRNIENKKNDYLHRFILNLSRYDKQIVDHINLNPLDNRKINLRITDQAGNQRNQRKRNIKTTSKYKGVYKCNRTGKFCSEIKFNYKKIWIGRFETEEEAAKAYNKKAKEIHGEFAHLNKVKK